MWIRGQEIKLLLFSEDFAIIMKQKAKHLLNMVSVFLVRLSSWRGWCSILRNAVASSPAVKNSCSINDWNRATSENKQTKKMLQVFLPSAPSSLSPLFLSYLLNSRYGLRFYKMLEMQYRIPENRASSHGAYILMGKTE